MGRLLQSRSSIEKVNNNDESQRKRKRGEKKSSSSRFYYNKKRISYLWSETWSQRPRHALRGEDVRFLRLDPPESLFGALFLLNNKEKSVRWDVCFPISMGFFPPPQKHHSAKNKSARTKKRKNYEKRWFIRTLMIKNGRPYSSNARDMMRFTPL